MLKYFFALLFQTVNQIMTTGIFLNVKGYMHKIPFHQKANKTDPNDLKPANVK